MGSAYKYTVLAGNTGEAESQTSARRKSFGKSPRTWCLRFVVTMFTLVLLFQLWSALIRATHAVEPGSQGDCDTPDGGFQCNSSISHNWGQYSPFFLAPSEIDASVPSGCEVTFAQILSRHGARDPTASATAAYGETIEQIQSSVTNYGEGFEFIKDYQYTLGADQLSDFGRQEMFNSGVHFYNRYQILARNNTPFFRSDGQQRVVESGQKWTEGFHQALLGDSGRAGGPADEFPYKMVIIPNEDGTNNTLNHNLCTAFENTKLGKEAQKEFMESAMGGITERLNNGLEGANLTTKQAVQIMELCPFETVADPQATLSQFCTLFTQRDWEAYDYLQTLGKWYGYGNGNPLGSTQGVGFVNELIARLLQKPVEDHTNTNSTLDSDPSTFPLDKKLYADFSHDNDMLGIYAALGIYNATAPDSVPKKERRSAQELSGFSSSWAVPFAARMFVEKMTCAGQNEELVRILVNDRVTPLQNCDADSMGRCTLSKFVESLSFARSGGRWDQCFV
ncbi:phytase [Pyricularia oryzae]|nr:phytase [Pyricularia oryzae]KAI7924986.1 phytase [Pyricularia oryzae]